MERIIRRLLLVWLLLLGSAGLAHHYGYAQLATRLLWPVALASPAVALALLALMALRLWQVWQRARVLWRARHWRRAARQWPPDEPAAEPAVGQGSRQK